MRYILVLLGVIFLAGCMTVRTYEVEKARIDTDVQGNRGFLYGTPDTDVPENRLGPTRKISVVEVEFGSLKKKDQPIEDSYQESLAVDDNDSLDLVDAAEGSNDVDGEKEYSVYLVKKNDTLQKISNEFYGTTRKWMIIYNRNKDVLKSPDRLYPGIKLKIPVLE